MQIQAPQRTALATPTELALQLSDALLQQGDRRRAAALLETRGSEPALITRTRHREALAAARDALADAEHAAAPELIAEELRRAGDAIGRITGRTGVEDMLDLLFAQFCIGK